LVVADLIQWIENGHSIKKYINIHFPKHFNDIYDHDAKNMKDSLNMVISTRIPSLEDERIRGRLINMVDKIFSDICEGDLNDAIKSNKEYWIYFNKIIRPGFKTISPKSKK
jgi:hypothetical protein